MHEHTPKSIYPIKFMPTRGKFEIQ